jgi:hypothetical protein
MKRKWNVPIWAGFLLVVVGFLSYFLFFARFPFTRDFPWLNLSLISAGLVLQGAGLWRAFREPAKYRGKIAGTILAIPTLAVAGLFVAYNFYLSRQVPASSAAPRVGALAPDFSLAAADGRTLSLDDLLREPVASRRPRAVLLIFYRGYW